MFFWCLITQLEVDLCINRNKKEIGVSKRSNSHPILYGNHHTYLEDIHVQILLKQETVSEVCKKVVK